MKFAKTLLLIVSLLVLLGLGLYLLQSREVTDSTSGQPALKSAESDASVATVMEQESAAKPIPSVAMESLNAEEKSQLQVLAEIFKSKNDNDPRMDQVLKNLSEPVKLALMQKYRETKAEKRNELGTIAFLIGRELKEGRGSLTDTQFLKNILLEKPCMSLSDCTKVSQSQTVEEEHLEGIHETTAQYPQLMALRYLRQSLESGNLSPEVKASVIAALEAARHSPNARVVQEAQSILDSLLKN